VASDVIWSTIQRAAASAAVAMRWRCLCMARSDDQPEKYGVAQAPSFARRIAINLLGRVDRALNGLTDGTVCSVDAVTGAEIGPYRKSRLKAKLRVSGPRASRGGAWNGISPAHR
jgi:hypothetical protein